jgi:CheY-like chemotaxis protein
MNKFFNVLLADDDIDDQQFFIDALRGLKIGAQEAHRHINLTRVYDGKQALEFLLKEADWKNTRARLPDFVVLDLNMPVLDGFQVLEEIQKHDKLKEIPIYVLTTLRDEGAKQRCTSLGCAGFFAKPMNLKELREVIGDILKKLI